MGQAFTRRAFNRQAFNRKERKERKVTPNEVHPDGLLKLMILFAQGTQIRHA